MSTFQMARHRGSVSASQPSFPGSYLGRGLSGAGTSMYCINGPKSSKETNSSANSHVQISTIRNSPTKILLTRGIGIKRGDQMPTGDEQSKSTHTFNWRGLG